MARSIVTLLTVFLPTCYSLHIVGRAETKYRKPSADISPTRRSILLHSPFLALTTTVANAAPDNAAPNLQFTTTSTGLQYADVKSGSSGNSPTNGQAVSIDYVMSTTGARYGSKIYSTQAAGAPHRRTLGDGSTIPGLEEAVKGMSPGGIRRVIIPSKLAYQSSSAGISKSILFCFGVAIKVMNAVFLNPSLLLVNWIVEEECENGKGLGPIPPASQALGEFQRFKNIYCNPDRVYQPDLVMDVKLYGKR